jgi:hypothetical protein
MLPKKFDRICKKPGLYCLDSKILKALTRENVNVRISCNSSLDKTFNKLGLAGKPKHNRLTGETSTINKKFTQ